MAETKHQVQRAEDLVELAAARGFESTAPLRDHPDNQALMAIRTDGILKKGDQLVIPDAESPSFELSVGEMNTFHTKAKERQMILRLLDDDGQPLAGVTFKVAGDGLNFECTTDGNGKLQAAVPAIGCRRLTLTSDEHQLTVAVGDLDPVSSLRGVQGRLANLGYRVGARDGTLGAATRACLLQFQAVHGIPPTGHADDATRLALLDEHGS